MALFPQGIQAALEAHRASGVHPFLGPQFVPLCQGVSAAVAAWAVSNPINLSMTGATAGAAGSGIINAVTTKILVPPTTPLMIGALQGAGFNGPVAVALGTTVALGIAQAFTTSAQYIGVSPSVAVGPDVSKITVANPATLMVLLQGSLTASLGPGPLIPQLAQGLSQGISSLLLLGTGVGSVVGGATPVPAAGITTSVVV